MTLFYQKYIGQRKTKVLIEQSADDVPREIAPQF